MMSSNEISSFRDNSGNLYWHEGILYRNVNLAFKDNYDLLLNSGLYEKLISANSLISHEEVENPITHQENDNVYKTLKPTLVPFISYPYEWSFTQLKHAALLTLQIQKQALSCGMTLKDASAYNIQFYNGKPLFIDTLSFIKYEENQPWVAYGQFCRHFLGPLIVAAYTDVRLTLLLKEFIDGIPLDLVSKLVPFKAKTQLLYIMHIATQNKAKSYVVKEAVKEKEIKVGKRQLLSMIDMLYSGVDGLQTRKEATTWGDYYNITNYTETAMAEKVQIVSSWTHEISPKVIWDLGGNNGKFCRDINYPEGLFVCLDNDVTAVEDCYQQIVAKKENNIIPLTIDLTNPTGGIGWNNMERLSLQRRGPADMAYALALIHHLAIGNNLPFEYICKYFSTFTEYLVIEFVPKEDSQVKKLLSLKEDVFTNYTVQNFERVFKNTFDTLKRVELKESNRILYLMKKNEKFC